MCAAGLATHLTTPVCPVARTQTIILQVVYFTPPRQRRGSFLVFHRDQRDLLCCSGPISSDEQTRNHDDLLLRRFESGGKLGFFRCHHEHNRRKPGLEGLCGFCFFALAVVGQSTSEALFQNIFSDPIVSARKKGGEER